MASERQYTKAELRELQQAASDLLGSQISFEQLNIAGVGTVRARTLSTRDKVAIAVSQVELFPTQDDEWQKRLEVGSGGRARAANQIYAGMSLGNPLVGVVLPRGPQAKTDPLARIKRILVAQKGGKADEVSWSKFLKDPPMGINAQQIADVMVAMNFENVTYNRSPVRISPITDFTPGIKRVEPPDDAHDDLYSVYSLQKASLTELKSLLIRRLSS